MKVNFPHVWMYQDLAHSDLVKWDSIGHMTDWNAYTKSKLEQTYPLESASD